MIKEKNTNKNKKSQEIIAIIDMSGSMSGSEENVIKSYNDYLKEIATDETYFTTVTTMLFDNQFDVIEVSVPVSAARGLNKDNYKPRGSTALFDAIGHSLSLVEKSYEQKNELLDDVIVLIFTDGQENASKVYKRETISHLIKTKSDKGYKFVYLGADQDAWSHAKDLGLSRHNTVSYSKSDMEKMGRYLAKSTMDVRSGMVKVDQILSSVGSTPEDQFNKFES